jgi:hypothetical protein
MNALLPAVRFVAQDLLGSLLWFPVWWYTSGVLRVVRLIIRQVKGLVAALNLKILFQFLLKPMFGQADFAGRVISFFVRIFHFFFLFLYTIIVTVLYSALLVLWLALPLLVVWSILFHLGVPLPYAG